MMNYDSTQGINYPLSFLQNGKYPETLFWLGIKPLNFADLKELVANISTNHLLEIIKDLQNNYLISPIKQGDCFTLTNGGHELAQLVTSLSVWGRQQIDENNGEPLRQVVLPDSTMEQNDLLKYRDEMKYYL